MRHTLRLAASCWSHASSSAHVPRMATWAWPCMGSSTKQAHTPATLRTACPCHKYGQDAGNGGAAVDDPRYLELSQARAADGGDTTIINNYGSTADTGFGGGGAAPKGQDVEYPVDISFHEAFHGGERQVSYRLSDGASHQIKVRIPRGAKDGARLRVSGKGAASPYGGPAGDLFIILRVAKDPRFVRNGDDIEAPVSLKISEALLGTTRDVETMDGVKKIRIPAGVKVGTKVRLKSLGFPVAGTSDQRGDFYAVVAFDVPTQLTPAQKAAVEALQTLDL